MTCIFVFAIKMSQRRDKIICNMVCSSVGAVLWILWTVLCYHLWLKHQSFETESNKLPEEPPDCWTTSCLPTSMSDVCSGLSEHYQIFFQAMVQENCSVAKNGIPGRVAVCCQLHTNGSLLVSTTMAEAHEFPHHASIKSHNGLCGATIYNSRFLITAAHCLVNGTSGQVTNASLVKATVGTNFKLFAPVPEFVYGVQRVIPHPEYSKLATSLDAGKRRIINDIALLELNSNITFGKDVKALEIASKQFDPFQFAESLVMVGWGKSDGLQGTRWLQKSTFLLRSDESCFEPASYKTYSDSKNRLLCGGGIMDGELSPVAGIGDSGGPGVCRDENERPVLCGVVSLTPNNANCQRNWNEQSCYPTVFAEVSYFHDWIKEVAGPQEENSLYKTFLFGQTVDKTDYPHQVRISSQNEDEIIMCGGTLIQPDVVLTDAYCIFYDAVDAQNVTVSASTGESFAVKLAKYFQSDNNVEHTRRKRALVNVFNQVQDMQMTDHLIANDLAVLLLNDSVSISLDRLPRMPKSGEVFSEGQELSFNSDENLISRKFELFKPDYCNLRVAALNWTLDKNILCGVEKYSGGSTCDRDYGGGLLCQGTDDQTVLCGISIYRQCMFSIPNAFLDVGLLRDWILTTIQELRK